MTHNNIFEGPYYIPPTTIISLEGLTYGENYVQEEINIINPQLEALGYTDIKWLPGETDSFGPLTRLARAYNAEGDLVWFTYG
jgi:hypothetical protein